MKYFTRSLASQSSKATDTEWGLRCQKYSEHLDRIWSKLPEKLQEFLVWCQRYDLHDECVLELDHTSKRQVIVRFARSAWIQELDFDKVSRIVTAPPLGEQTFWATLRQIGTAWICHEIELAGPAQFTFSALLEDCEFSIVATDFSFVVTPGASPPMPKGRSPKRKR